MAPDPVLPEATVRFGEDFELDVGAYLLRRGRRVVKLERIPMELLRLLVERRGKLVSREEFVERIWGKDVFLDTDNSINGAIRKLRQALKDDPERPQFIETVTGRGYRFIAPVVSAEAENETVVETPRRSGPNGGVSETPTAPQTSRSVRRWAVLSIAALVLIPSIGVWLLYSDFFRESPVVSEKLMIAVLPFQNLTGEAAQEHFSDGFTEEIITQLGDLDPNRLGVIARTSVMRYKNSGVPSKEIGRELGVHYVLEGSVRRDLNRVRVSVQLIQIKDETLVWARKYDRELNSLLVVQGEIAEGIADEIQVTLGGKRPRAVAQRALSPNEFEAYDLYLRGQYFFNKRNVEGLSRAAEYFRQATAKDPNDARAHAGLADAYMLLAAYSLAPQEDLASKARAAALRAVEIDGNLAEAHTALALYVQNHDWDWRTAETEFRRAIELKPNYATAHHWYAEHLMWRGRFDEALKESKLARQLDPLSLIIAADYGAILYYARRYDQAIDRFGAVLKMEPDFARAHLIANAYVEMGAFSEALDDIEKHMQARDPVWYWSVLAYACGRSGQTARARRALEQLKTIGQKQRLDPGAFVWAYAGMGDNDNAFAWLEKAYLQRSNTLTALKVEPGFDSLRGDSRFQDLLRRVGLAD